MYSSIGYHTISIFKKLTLEESFSLYENFLKFRNEMKEVKIRPIRISKITTNSDPFIEKLYANMPKCYRIEYTHKYKGIKWDMRRSLSSPEYIKSKTVGEDKPCSIKAKITPKVFNGEKDYLSLATVNDFRDIENLFNIETTKISALLGKFDTYKFNRIDYCFNCDTRELDVGCTTDQMMQLIKRANIPDSFTEMTEYDKSSNRKKPYKHSFYLKSNSIVINCYYKGMQLENQYPDNPSLKDASNLIRFEVQCKYPKINTMSLLIERRNEERKDNSNLYMLNEMLSNEVCEDVITKYFNKIIRKGDYFTLNGSRRIVESHNFRCDKEDRLIYALELINECRGIAKAKSKLTGLNLKDFKRSLNDLDDILVNPVTIPRDWGIEYIPNLLRSYYNEIFDEQIVTDKEFKARECISECLSKKSI